MLQDSPAPATSPHLKVPAINMGFWAIKILTTGFGETTSDFVVRQFNAFLAIGAAGLLLLAALALQWWATTYSPWRYWAAVAMVAVFGTMIADAIHVVLGVPYPVSTAAFSLALIIIFVLWHAFEGTLAIHSVTTRRRETFYWAAVIATFALGTAAGDMTAAVLRLGYCISGVLFSVLFALPFIGRALFGWNRTVTFWAAYILTRPLGASFADWVGVPHDRGGLAWGTGPVSISLAIFALATIALLGDRSQSFRDRT